MARSNRAYLSGWLDCLTRLTDIHTKPDNRKVFYDHEERTMLDISDRHLYKFTYHIGDEQHTIPFDDSDISGILANRGDNLFSIVLHETEHNKEGFCLKFRLFKNEDEKTYYHGQFTAMEERAFTLGDFFRKKVKHE